MNYDVFILAIRVYIETNSIPTETNSLRIILLDQIASIKEISFRDRTALLAELLGIYYVDLPYQDNVHNFIKAVHRKTWRKLLQCNIMIRDFRQALQVNNDYLQVPFKERIELKEKGLLPDGSVITKKEYLRHQVESLLAYQKHAKRLEEGYKKVVAEQSKTKYNVMRQIRDLTDY